MAYLFRCLLVFFLFAPLLASAQDAYFQQSVNYDIRVRLDDEAGMLHAHLQLDYQNNSNETLDRLYIHLWPNAYRDNTSAFARQKRESGSILFEKAPPERRGYIDSLDFEIDGQKVTFSPWNNHPDVAVIMLPKPLKPAGKIRLETPFRVKIPSSFSRLGHIGEQFQLCQWYPKPAVFDRDGWHPMPYLDQGEFYSEFGTFDVYIEVPKNYVVGATGDLPADDPEWEWLRKREQLSREMLDKPLTEAIFPLEFPADETKTLHFHQENVHDFAWFCDKSYYVLADTVKLKDSGREVRCVAMFTNLDRQYWVEGPRYVAQSVYDYSRWNGDYPYNHATAVDGALSAGAGMEYPNITVLGAGGNAGSLERVIMHEVGHNWYYGMLGSNERLHPWMDEGLNTFFENRYWDERHNGTFTEVPDGVDKLLGISNITGHFIAREGYRALSTSGDDQPIELHSARYSSINYGLMVYMKTGQAFRYLESYLGKEVTDRCFHAYFDRWKFKHPQPEDLQAVFEEISGKDLNWFFGPFVSGTQQLDFRIKKVKDNVVTLQNKLDIALPASLSLLDKEGNILETIWTEPFTGETEVELPSGDAHAYKVDAEQVIPEYRVNNNRVRAKGVFKKANPLRLAFGYKYPDPDRFTLNLLPVLGFNTTDGVMAGLLIHHGFLPKKRFGFDLMPMFGFESLRLVGSGGFGFRWANVGAFKSVELKSRFSSFSTFARNRTSLDFNLRKKEVHQPGSHTFSLVSQILAFRSLEFGLLPSDWYLPVYGAAVWDFQSKGLYSKFRMRTELGGNLSEGLGRLSVDARYKRKLGKRMRADVRGFVGLIASKDPAPFLLQYRVSGSADPFGEQVLLDRAAETSWLSNQVVNDHGGFSSMTGASFDRGLLALNGHFKLPVPLLGVFGDVAYGLGTAGIPNRAFYDVGLRLTVFDEILYFNFPIAGTAFGGFPADGEAFTRGINFSLNLGNLGRLTDLSNLINN